MIIGTVELAVLLHKLIPTEDLFADEALEAGCMISLCTGVRTK